jgi:hypothetical protein
MHRKRVYAKKSKMTPIEEINSEQPLANLETLDDFQDENQNWRNLELNELWEYFDSHNIQSSDIDDVRLRYESTDDNELKMFYEAIILTYGKLLLFLRI